MLKRILPMLLGLLVIAASSHAASLVGNLDTVNHNGDGFFRGWVCELGAPSTALNILIFRNDGNDEGEKYIGRTTTGSDPRPDTSGICGAGSSAGWKFAIPMEEYFGGTASWTARIDTGTSDVPYPGYPNWGASAVHASLPFISTLNYITPTCFWENADKGGIVNHPGGRLDDLASFWGFTTAVNGATPLDPVTTYDAGVYTGMNTAPYQYYFQRGDNRTSGSAKVDAEMGRSVLQRNCTSAGIMTNNFWLDGLENPAMQGGHGGQHGIVWSIKDDRKLKLLQSMKNVMNTYQPGRLNPASALRRPFASGSRSSSIVFEGEIMIPKYHAGEREEPSGQVNYYVYFWDTSSGQSIGVVLNLWDSRANFSFLHGLGNDGNTNFASQTRVEPNGPYATFDTSVSGTWAPGETFSSPKKFRVAITAQNLLNIIDGLDTGLSTRLHDYVLTDASFGTEINGDMLLGASINNFSVYSVR